MPPNPGLNGLLDDSREMGTDYNRYLLHVFNRQYWAMQNMNDRVMTK